MSGVVKGEISFVGGSGKAKLREVGLADDAMRGFDGKTEG